MKLIDNWNQFWRFLSVQIAAAGIVLDILSSNIVEIREYIGPEVARYVYLAIIVARVIAQKSVTSTNHDRDGGGDGVHDAGQRGSEITTKDRP